MVVLRAVFFILILGCASKFNPESNTFINSTESYYTLWSSPIRDGGSGYSVYIVLDKNLDLNTKHIEIQGIYFKDKYCKLKSLGDQKYQCSILMNENRETNFSPPIVLGTSKIEKSPFTIEGDDAVVVYIENKKRKYIKITMLWKKMQHLPM